MQLLLRQPFKLIRSYHHQFCSNKKLQEELLNNPLFDKAFPDLAQHKEPTTIAPEAQEYPFFDSMKKYYKHNQSTLTKNDKENMNYKRFVEGFQSPRGPLKYMSEEAKQLINLEVDQKLRELEDTGLSREEILTNGKKKGVPLIQDSFFQHLKNNYQARSVYINENEEYTAKKVVEIALRQNLGPDQFGNARDPTAIDITKPTLKHRPNKYYNEVLQIQSKEEMINSMIKQDLIYAPQNPKLKKTHRMANMRRINNYDIHWRNTEFLCQFMNGSGKINNKYKTFLDSVQQNKVSKAIKAARNMLLLPVSNFIQPHFRKSLTSLQDDVEDHIRMKVNLSTGQLYYETPSLRLERNLEDLAHQYDYELQHGQSVVTEDQVQLLKAQAQADLIKQEQLKQQGVDIDHLKKQAEGYGGINKISIITNTVRFEVVRNEDQLKQQIESDKDQSNFEIVKNEVKKIPLMDLPQALIYESALDYEKVPQFLNIYQLKSLQLRTPGQKLTKQESMDIINKVRSMGGLQNLKLESSI